MPTMKTMLEKAINSVGGRREFERKRKQYSDNINYFESHFLDLIEQFNDEWIAIHNSRFVGHSKSYRALEKELTEQLGLPLGEVVVKFLTKRKITTLF